MSVTEFLSRAQTSEVPRQRLLATQSRRMVCTSFSGFTTPFILLSYNTPTLRFPSFAEQGSAWYASKLKFNDHGRSRISSSLFLHRIGELWSCLPPSLTSIDSLSQFKQALRIHWAKYTFACRGVDSQFLDARIDYQLSCIFPLSDSDTHITFVHFHEDPIDRLRPLGNPQHR